MLLRDWYKRHPMAYRQAIIDELALATGREPKTVRSWIDGTRVIPAEFIPAIVRVSRGEVGAADCRAEFEGTRLVLERTATTP